MPRGIFGLRKVVLCGIHPLTRRYKLIPPMTKADISQRQ